MTAAADDRLISRLRPASTPASIPLSASALSAEPEVSGQVEPLGPGWLTVAVIIGIMAALIALGGMILSFRAVSAEMVPAFGARWAWLVPIVVDLTVFVFSGVDLVLARLDMSHPLARWTVYGATGGTVWLNYSAGGSAAGRVAHVLMPAIWVVFIELMRHVVRRQVNLATASHREPIPTTRWLLSPWPTLKLWRRMVLWRINSYPRALEQEKMRLGAVAAAREMYGRFWRLKISPLTKLQINLGELGAHDLRPGAVEAGVGVGIGAGGVVAPVVEAGVAQQVAAGVGHVNGGAAGAHAAADTAAAQTAPAVMVAPVGVQPSGGSGGQAAGVGQGGETVEAVEVVAAEVAAADAGAAGAAVQTAPVQGQTVAQARAGNGVAAADVGSVDVVGPDRAVGPDLGGRQVSVAPSQMTGVAGPVRAAGPVESVTRHAAPHPVNGAPNGPQRPQGQPLQPQTQPPVQVQAQSSSGPVSPSVGQPQAQPPLAQPASMGQTGQRVPPPQYAAGDAREGIPGVAAAGAAAGAVVRGGIPPQISGAVFPASLPAQRAAHAAPPAVALRRQEPTHVEFQAPPPMPPMPRRSMRESELLTAAREVERWRGQPSATRISRELGIGMPLATSLANALREEEGPGQDEV